MVSDLEELMAIMDSDDRDNLIRYFMQHKIRSFIDGDKFYIELPNPVPPNLHALVRSLYVPFRHLFVPDVKFRRYKSGRPSVAVYRAELRD